MSIQLSPIYLDAARPASDKLSACGAEATPGGSRKAAGMSKEESIRRMKTIGQLFTLTAIAVPLMSIVIAALGGPYPLELCLLTLPLWILMLLAGVVMWIVAYIKEGSLQ